MEHGTGNFLSFIQYKKIQNVKINISFIKNFKKLR